MSLYRYKMSTFSKKMVIQFFFMQSLVAHSESELFKCLCLFKLWSTFDSKMKEILRVCVCVWTELWILLLKVLWNWLKTSLVFVWIPTRQLKGSENFCLCSWLKVHYMKIVHMWKDVYKSDWTSVRCALESQSYFAWLLTSNL